MLKYNIETLDDIVNNSKVYDWWQIRLESITISIIQDFILSCSYEPAHKLINFITDKYPNNIEIYYYKGYLFHIINDYINSQTAYDIFRDRVKTVKLNDEHLKHYLRLIVSIDNPSDHNAPFFQS
jgi:hypothetical protein